MMESKKDIVSQDHTLGQSSALHNGEGQYLTHDTVRPAASCITATNADGQCMGLLTMPQPDAKLSEDAMGWQRTKRCVRYGTCSADNPKILHNGNLLNVIARPSDQAKSHHQTGKWTMLAPCCPGLHSHTPTAKATCVDHFLRKKSGLCRQHTRYLVHVTHTWSPFWGGGGAQLW